MEQIDGGVVTFVANPAANGAWGPCSSTSWSSSPTAGAFLAEPDDVDEVVHGQPGPRAHRLPPSP